MPKKINHRLRAARYEKCWTVEQAAQAVGVCTTTYIRWENYDRTPYPGSLKLLTEAFGVTDPTLLGFSYAYTLKNIKKSR